MRGFAVACCAFAVACGKPCSDGTVLLTLAYDRVAAAADALEFSVDVGGTASHAERPHAPGRSIDTVEIDFAKPGYPRGHALAVDVVAKKNGAAIGAGRAETALNASCETLTVQIGALASPVADMAAPAFDLSVTPTVDTIAFGGPFALGAVYEAESNVVVLVKGSNFASGTSVSANHPAVASVGPPLVKGDGSMLAFVLRLVPVPSFGSSDGTMTVPLDIGGVARALPVIGLDELPSSADGGATSLPKLNTKTAYLISSVALESLGTLKVTCGKWNPAFLWVTGPIHGGTIAVDSSCAGWGAASGPGHGVSAGSDNGGGGAGYLGPGGDAAFGLFPGKGGLPYGDVSLVGLPGGSGGGNTGTFPGGDGGGVLRVVAGSLDSVQLVAAGAPGAVDPGTGAGAGAGSGGSVLLHAIGAVSATSLAAPAAPNKNGGGAASLGRTRADVGVRGDTASVNGAQYFGATFAEDAALVFSGAPSQLSLVCGLDTKFTILVDKLAAADRLTCAGNGTSPVKMNAPLSADGQRALSPGALHRVCIQTAQLTTQNTPYYADELAEDLNCRTVAVIAP